MIDSSICFTLTWYSGFWFYKDEHTIELCLGWLHFAIITPSVISLLDALQIQELKDEPSKKSD